MKQFRVCNTCDRFLPLTELNYSKVQTWFVRKCRKCVNKFQQANKVFEARKLNKHQKYFNLRCMYNDVDRKYYENEEEMIYHAPDVSELKGEELEMLNYEL